MKKERRFFDVEDFAKLKRVHPNTLRRLTREGVIQPVDKSIPYVFSFKTVRDFRRRPVGRPARKNIPREEADKK